MANPSESEVQNLLPVQAYFAVDGTFQTFIGQGQPFYASVNPQQSGLHITNSTIDSSTIGATTPSTGVFTNVATTTGTVSTTPANQYDLVNKAYVDATAQGLSFKQPALVASTANIPTLSGLLTIDGVTLVAGDRVLVKNQSTQADNGIYIASASAWARAADANTWDELLAAYLFILEGDVWKGSAWVCTDVPGGTLGVTPVVFVQFSNNATYTAGTGLTLTGFQFSITNTGVSAATYGSATASAVLAINAQGQVTSASNTTITPAVGSITGLGTGVATWLATPSSANLAAAVSDETGTGALVFANSPTLVTPILGTPTSGTLTNCTGYPASALSGTLGIAGGGTGQTTASAAFNALSPITTTGDMIYGSAANTSSRLAIGTSGQILSVVAGIPAWVNAPSSMVYPGAGIPNSTGSAWGTSYSTTGSGTVVALQTSAALVTPTLSAATIDGASPYLNFNNGAGTTLAAGRMWYDGATGAWNLGMGNGNITQQVGEEIFVYGKASAAITEGQLICQTGTVGASGVITFGPSPANLSTNDGIIGVATENIALNGFGRITFFGVIHGIDTTGSSVGETWADNDTLWYNPAGAGKLTNVKPVAPNIKYSVAKVINAGSGSSGSIQVYLEPGSTLGGTDSNVQINGVANGNILSYDGGNGYWKNTDLTAGTGISISKSANGVLTVANTVTGGITVTDDTTTNATRYLTFTSATSGSVTGQNVSSTKLQFNPSTGAFTATSLTPTNAVGVAYGGTGATSATAYAVQCGGTTSTGPYQSVSGVGTAGQVLTSAGAGALPTWQTPGGGFSTGTVILFYQAAAPTGWTQVTTQNNKSLRVVSGTGGGTGGSVAFTTAFASQAVTGSISVTVGAGTLAVGAGTFAVGATTLSTSQIPSHTHNISTAYDTNVGGTVINSFANNSYPRTNVTAAEGGGGSHTHSLTGAPSLSGSPSVTAQSFTGTAINLAVQYIDIIICSKD